MSSNYSVDDGDGTNLCGGLTREAATREAKNHANRTGLACLVYDDEGYAKEIEPEEPDDDAEPEDDAEPDGDADGPAAVGTAARDAADAALVGILTPEQLERHAIGALPARELRWAVLNALVNSVAERLGDGFLVDVIEEVVPTWGELPPGGFHVVRRLGLVPGVLFVDWRPVGGRLTRWGNASELATGPVVAIAATADDGTEYVLGVSRT